MTPSAAEPVPENRATEITESTETAESPDSVSSVSSVASSVPPAPDECRALAVVPDEDPGWLGRLAGGVVHELKNPLSTIHLNLELLRDEWARVWSASPEPRERRSLRRLDLVLRETRRLDAMLKDFLRFTRADRIAPEPTDLAALADEVLAFVAPESDLRRIDVRREYDATLGPVRADPALVKQAILNLVQNAQDAMSERGGQLVVRVESAPGEARLSVSDAGIGIAGADLPHLFELYRTTKPDGTGLGLATTKRIAEAHGGRIDVESALGRGSRLTLARPATGRLKPEA